MERIEAPDNAKAARSYWIFQYLPDDPTNKDIENPASIGTPVAWRLAQFVEFIHPDDIVFYWRAGSMQALTGWGEVQGERYRDEGDRVDSIRVITRAILGDRLPKADLINRPELANVAVIRQGRRGTNFRLAIDEAGGIVRLLAELGLPYPAIDWQELSASLSPRIERGLLELGKIAEALPDATLRQQLAAAINQISSQLAQPGLVTAGAAEPLSDIIRRIVELQRRGEWSANVEISALGDQVTSDLQRFQALSQAPAIQASMNSLSLSSLDETTTGNVTNAAPAASVGVPPPPPKASPPVPPIIESASPASPPPGAASAAGPTPPAMVPAPDDHWYCAWQQDDLVGIGPEVTNFARYICHRELVPPRAIGVFGEWGSGKSFLLRALRSQIALYSAQSRDARRSGLSTVFCGQVVQIEFNAWHYVESNLWASLAGYIFEQLYAELQHRISGVTPSSELDALYQSLELYKESIAERDRLQAAESDLKDIESKLQDEATQARLTRSQKTAGIRTAIQAALNEAYGRVPKETRTKIGTLSRQAGVPAVEQAITKSKRAVEEGRSLFGRIYVAAQTWGPWPLVFLGLASAGVVFGVPWLVGALFAKDSDSLVRGAVTLGSYVTLGTTAMELISRQGSRLIGAASETLDVLDRAEAAAREKATSELAGAKQKVAEIEARLAAASEALADQRRRILEARDRLDPRHLGTRLKEFLEDRARSKAYEEYLGLITLVRRDFEKLSDLMTRNAAQQSQPIPTAILEADGIAGAPKVVPFIERIVLYIDDLDRCPPQKVVEVLQAVHLMLGFQLFVVVVAVDVRWVRDSLLKHYPDLLTRDVAGTRGDPAKLLDTSDRQAEADDYLEKIFQIPFRIPPLSADMRERLVDGLLREQVQSTAAQSPGPGIVERLDLTPKELKLYPVEESAIRELSDSVGVSPRRVRRFLDVYRLMRAGMPDGIVELITRTTRQHRVVLGLFSLLSGASAIAPRLLEQLYALVQTAPAPVTPAAPPLSPPPNRTNPLPLATWMRVNADPRVVDAFEQAAMMRAAGFLDSALTDGKDLPAALLQWIPEVSRYSFREVRLAPR